MKEKLIEVQNTLKKLKENLTKEGEYAIKRVDGKNIHLGEAIMFGTIFETFDDFLELDLEEIGNYDLLKNRIEEIHQETEEECKKPFILVVHANYVEGRNETCTELLKFINELEGKE